MDGYVNFAHDSCSLLEDQEKINNEIYATFDEIRNMPRLPSDINKWISSINLTPAKVFKISDLSKIRKINKKIHSLMERQEANSKKIKEIAIDDLLNKINNVLK